MTAGEIMNMSASLLNDTARTLYTYTAQIPYLNMAKDELKEQMELNNVPFTDTTSTSITVNAGVLGIGDTAATPAQPALPTGLVEIRELWERDAGSTEDYIPMNRCTFVPKIDVPTTWLIWWQWTGQLIKFISVGATSDRDILIDYILDNLADFVDETSTITLINAKSFLGYRTAALCAEFIGENKARADDLNTFAQMALDRFLGINTKGRQAMVTRRRPFMAGYKVRGKL